MDSDRTARPATSSRPAESWRDRLTRVFLKPPRGGNGRRSGGAEAVKPTVELTDEERAAKIRQADPRERKFGYLGAALVAIVAFLAFLPYVDNPSKPVSQTLALVNGSCTHYGPSFKDTLVHGAHKCVGDVVYSRGHWLLEMFIVLFFAVFVFVAAKIGRRSGLAFAALFAGLAVEATTGSIVGILFVFGGGWLLVRAWRVQRYGAPDAATARAAIAERSAARRNGTGGSTSSGSSGSSGFGGLFRRRPAKQDAPTAERKPPSANKRYTPKSPQRKRTPPPAR